MRQVLAVLALAGISGCSVGTRIATPTPTQACSITPPLVDTVIAGVLVAGLLAYARGDRATAEHDPIGLIVGGAVAVTSPLMLASAVYGFHRHTSCVEQREHPPVRAHSRTEQATCEQERRAQFVAAVQQLTSADREKQLRLIPASCRPKPAIMETRVEIGQLAIGGGAGGEPSGGTHRTAYVAAGTRVASGLSLHAIGRLGDVESRAFDATLKHGQFLRAGGGVMASSCIGHACAVVGFEFSYQRESRSGGEYEDGPVLGERVGVEVRQGWWGVQLTGESYLFNRYRSEFGGGHRADPLFGLGVNLAVVATIGRNGLTEEVPELSEQTVQDDAMWEQVLGVAIAAANHDCEGMWRIWVDMRPLPAAIAAPFDSNPDIRACGER